MVAAPAVGIIPENCFFSSMDVAYLQMYFIFLDKSMCECGANAPNDGSVPSSVAESHDSKPACTIPGLWNSLIEIKCSHL